MTGWHINFNTPATSPHSNTPSPTNNSADDSEDEEDTQSNEDIRHLEDLLPDSAESSFDPSAEDWLEISGECYLKASLVSQHLKANRSKKVVERTLRVRGLLGPLHPRHYQS